MHGIEKVIEYLSFIYNVFVKFSVCWERSSLILAGLFQLGVYEKIHLFELSLIWVEGYYGFLKDLFLFSFLEESDMFLYHVNIFLEIAVNYRFGFFIDTIVNDSSDFTQSFHLKVELLTCIVAEFLKNFLIIFFNKLIVAYHFYLIEWWIYVCGWVKY